MPGRYKYQRIQALDDKIGRDLRPLVEEYLGPNPDKTRGYKTDTCCLIKIFVWWDDGGAWLRHQAELPPGHIAKLTVPLSSRAAYVSACSAAMRGQRVGEPLPLGPLDW